MNKELIMTINLNSTGVRNLIKLNKNDEGNWKTQKSSSLETIRKFANKLDNNKKGQLSLIIECSHVLLKKGSLLFGGSTPLIKESLINQLRKLNPNTSHNELSKIASAIEKLVTHNHETFSFKTSTTKRMDYLFQGNTVENQNIPGINNPYRNTFSNTRNYEALRQIVKDYQKLDENGKRYNIANQIDNNDYASDQMKDAHDMIYLLMSSPDIKKITEEAERGVLIQINDNLPHTMQTNIQEGFKNEKIRTNINTAITSNFHDREIIIRQHTKTISNLEEALHNLEDQKKELTENLQTQIQRNNNLQDQIFDISFKLHDTEKELKVKIQELKVLTETYNNNESKYTRKIEDLTIQKDNLTEEKDLLTQQKQRLERRIDDLNENLEKLTDIKQNLSDELSISEKTIKDLKKTISFNNNKIQNQTQKINKFKLYNDQLQEKNSKIQTEVKTQKQLLIEAKTRIGDFSKTVTRDTIVKTRRGHSGEIDSLSNIFHNVEDENDNYFDKEVQSQHSFIREDIKSILRKSQIFIQDLDDHIAKDKQQYLPGGFIERVEVKNPKAT